jgi:hypothetical protein
MPSVTYDYVYFQSGRHTRQPRASNGGFLPVPGLGKSVLSNVQPPSTIQVSSAFLPPTWSAGGQTFKFSFVNVSGGTSGGGTSFDPSMPPPPAAVGASPITVLAVYVPSGGNGSGKPDYGATIDCFDESTGVLVDNTFVAVSPDAAETSVANVSGWVDTTNAAETVVASTPIAPSGTDPNTVNANFDKWVNLQQPTSNHGISGRDLKVDQATYVSALAFYKAPAPLTECQTLLKNFNALEPKTNEVLLAYYLEKLSACSGPQYAAAVGEIKALLKELQNPPHR